VQPSESPLLARLARLDACSVSDALDQSNLVGVALGLTALSLRKRISGVVSTVQLGPADGRPPAQHLCSAAVEAADPGTIIVVAHNGRTDVAGWGGVLSKAASLNEVGGVVIDGACRDLDESTDLGLPVYGRAAVPITARGRIVEYDWNVPVSIADVKVAPGDFVIADGSGVVFIPRVVAEEVIGRAERIAAKERLMVRDLESGSSVSSVMGANYERMLELGDSA
jgi:4-hydroxy-4-methyl-2-oxoglutarate aldolase